MRVAVTPAPDRHWFSIPGTLDAHDVARNVSPQDCQSGLVAWAVGWPPATRGTRFCRTATTPGVMNTSLPQAPTVTDPSAPMTSEAAPATSGTTVRPSV